MYIPASSVQEFSFLFASLWYAFLRLVILMGGWWYPVIVIIYISVMTNDIEHLFMYVFGHLCIFSGKMSLQILCPSFNQIVWLFFLLSYISSLYILDIKLLLDI